MKNAVLYDGKFGEAVAGRLADQYPHVWESRELSDKSAAAAMGGGSFVAVLCGFIGAPILNRLDRIADKEGTCWMPVRLQERFLFAGPVIAPDAPCLDCFDRRTLMNSPYSRSSRIELTVRRFRSRSATERPDIGYTPAIVSMAVALISEAARNPSVVAGHCWQVDCLSPVIDRIETTPVPGCRRCEPLIGSRDGSSAHASVAALAANAPLSEAR